MPTHRPPIDLISREFMSDSTMTLDHESDEQLLARIVLEEQAAFSALYERWANILLGIGSRFVPSRTEAEDVLHDVFLEIWKTAKDFDPNRGTARTWIVMKMRCRMLDHVRKKQRHRALAPQVKETMTPTPNHAAPDQSYAHGELRDTITKLPERLQKVLVLTYFHHMPAHEIAAKLDIPTGTVKSRLASARRELKSLLHQSTSSQGKPHPHTGGDR